jgi:hypothetical protein
MSHNHNFYKKIKPTYTVFSTGPYYIYNLSGEEKQNVQPRAMLCAYFVMEDR